MLYSDDNANLSSHLVSGWVSTTWTPTEYDKSVNKTKPNASSGEEKGTPGLSWIYENFIVIPLIIVGLIGNTLAFAVLCSRGCRGYRRPWQTHRSISTLLQVLSIADSAVLLSAVPLLEVIRDKWLIKHLHSKIYPWMFTAMYWFRTGNIWLTVVLTVNRYAVVCWPIAAHRLCTLRRTYAMIFLVVVTSLLASVPRFFEFRVSAVNVTNGNTSYTVKPTAFRYHVIYLIGYRTIGSTLLIYIIPMSTLVALNTRILVALRRSTGQLAKQLQQQQQQHQQLQPQHRHRQLGTASGEHGSVGTGGQRCHRESCHCSRCSKRRRHGNEAALGNGGHGSNGSSPGSHQQKPAAVDGNAGRPADELVDEKCVGQLSRRRGTTQSADNGRAGLRSVYGNVTIIVVVIVTCCVICNLSAMMANLFWSLEDILTGRGRSAVSWIRRHLSIMSKILVTLNSAINFFIYCVCSRDFRSALRQMLCAACCFWRSCMLCSLLPSETPHLLKRRHSPPFLGLNPIPDQAGHGPIGVGYPAAASFNRPNRIVIRPALGDQGGPQRGIRPDVVPSPVGKR